MPSRILKETVNESRGLSEASPFAQDLFKRLVTYADDYGRFNGDIQIMRARLYPREIQSVIEEDVEDAIIELVGVGKIRLYSAWASSNATRGSIVYGYFPNWGAHQRLRESKSKHPAPDPETEEVNDWALRRFVSVFMKRQILERDNFTCQMCERSFQLDGVGIDRAARLVAGVLHFDHIVPVIQGGRATLENLRLLCASCNLKRPKRPSLEEMAALAASRIEAQQLAATRGEVPLACAPTGIRSENPKRESEARSDSPIASQCPPADAGAKPRRGAKRPRTAPPDDFEANDADYAAGERVGLDREAVDSKALAMLDYHRKEGKDSADWHASLRTWLGNSVKFDQPRAGPGQRSGSSRPPPNSQRPPIAGTTSELMQTRNGTLTRR